MVRCAGLARGELCLACIDRDRTGTASLASSPQSRHSDASRLDPPPYSRSFGGTSANQRWFLGSDPIDELRHHELGWDGPRATSGDAKRNWVSSEIGAYERKLAYRYQPGHMVDNSFAQCLSERRPCSFAD